MKERPILFSAPMVRALLAGTKTQRRSSYSSTSGYGAPGDRLWVKETWATSKRYDRIRPARLPKTSQTHYLADGPKPNWCGRARPSLFMPRWVSRITLEVTGVRVERLQAITEADAKAEGVETEWTTEAGEHLSCSACEAYADLWRDINGPGSWVANPWVRVVSFKVLP